jgi:hypothetical protein
MGKDQTFIRTRIMIYHNEASLHFYQLTQDCLNRTDHSLPMKQRFAAARLSLLAQKMADELRN